MVLTTYEYLKEALRYNKRFADSTDGAKKVTILSKTDYNTWLTSQPAAAQSWLKNLGQDKHKAGKLVTVPNFASSDDASPVGELAYCLGEEAGSPFGLCELAGALPPGTYQLRGPGDSPPPEPDAAAFAWAMSAYSFERYKSPAPEDNESPDSGGGTRKNALLVWPEGADRARVESAAAATYLVRDLITTPCEDMGPQHLQDVAAALAEEFGGSFSAVVGDRLLEDRYPQIHAVGRAAGSGREPRLLDLTWGDPSHPKVTLVGKGVCFDTGGLDIKPSAGMLTMKKDMGGSAHVLGLARMVMSQKLPVRLRVLIPAVENAISGNAFRPGDVLTARNGKTSEIGNTDAEGRLVLADALVEASTESPDLLIDMATLTGAARVALGTEVPVVFCNDDTLAEQLGKISASVHDHVWRLPLWEGYRKQLKSSIADLKNVGAGGYGGAITAALYLDEFVGEKGKDKPKWVHMDVMAFNTAGRPGRPEGGEAQGMRAFFALLADRYK